MNRIIQDIPKDIIRYTQNSICSSFDDDDQTLPASWAYNIPLEIVCLQNGEYSSLDNRRLFIANECSPHTTTKCIVYQLDDVPSIVMVNNGMDRLQLIWRDNSSLLHRLILQANTIEAVLIIQCANQDSTFPIYGCFHPPIRGKRVYDPELFQIDLVRNHFMESPKSYQKSFQIAPEVFIRINNSRNVYHKRTSAEFLAKLDQFDVKYERCNAQMIARGDKDDSNNWDDMLRGLFDAESLARDEYEAELFKVYDFECAFIE